jgi:hypothetical protein
MKYDNNIDSAIAIALTNTSVLGYRELKRTIESHEYLDRRISFDTFNFHIKRMRANSQLINISNAKRGQKVSLCISPTFRQEINLDLFGGLKRGLAAEDTKRMYLMILYLFAIKPPLFREDKNYNLPGVSKLDIWNGQWFGYPFQLRRFTKKSINRCLLLLLKENVIKRVYESKGIARYDLVDKNFKRFIIRYWEIYETVYLRNVRKWKALERVTRIEQEWFEFLKGKEKAREEIENIRILRKKFSKEMSSFEYKKYVKDSKQAIPYFDANIEQEIIDLETEYSDVHSNYPALSKILKETIYPNWLKNDKRKIKGKVPKLLSFSNLSNPDSVNVIEKGKIDSIAIDDLMTDMTDLTTDTRLIPKKLDYNNHVIETLYLNYLNGNRVFI